MMGSEVVSMERERRHARRLAPAVRVRTEVLPESGDIHMAVFADIVNLSEEGVCLRSPLKLNALDRLVIYLPTLEEKVPLEIHGVIRWVRSAGPLMYEYGMEFVGIDKIMESNMRARIKSVMTSYHDQTATKIK
jgi:hypothetical protein